MIRIKNLELRVQNSIRGFTLIELLIVIAIIGVLSTLLMANFIGVRQRARDSQRKSDLRQIQAALEIYRSDVGSYPSSLATCTCSGNACLGNIGTSSPNCSTTYMQKIPADPSGSNYYNSGSYLYQSTDGTTYNLGACLENSGDNQGTANSPGGTGTCTSGKYYVLNNP